MTPRERQQLAYEIAFTPFRLDGLWRSWRADPCVSDPDELRALDEAAMLHLPLPEGSAAVSSAVCRLALYQAGAAPYAMRTYITNVRRHLGRPPIKEKEVPLQLIADVALPDYHLPWVYTSKKEEKK
jgi:hypothetical protein